MTLQRLPFLNLVAGIIALVMTAMLPLLAILTAYVNIPASNENLFSQLVVGYLAQLALVLGFFFGTTAGRKAVEDTVQQANATIHKLVTNPPPPPPENGAATLPLGGDGGTITTTTTTEVTPPAEGTRNGEQAPLA